jgi:hypothetical protein
MEPIDLTEVAPLQPAARPVKPPKGAPKDKAPNELAPVPLPLLPPSPLPDGPAASPEAVKPVEAEKWEEPPAESFRSISALPPPPVQENTQEEAEGQRTVAARKLRVLPRIGMVLPRTELSVGPLLGAELGYLLPFIEGRLRASFGVAYSLVTFKGARVVPGRGRDPGFVQNSTMVPLELLGTVDLLRPEDAGAGVSAGLGYGLYLTRSAVVTLGSTKGAVAAASALVLAARVLVPAGPGAVCADLRHAELRADLGSLSETAQGTLSGTSLAVGYALDF